MSVASAVRSWKVWTQDGWVDITDSSREYAERIQKSSPVRTLTRDDFARVEAEHRAAAEFKRQNQ